MATQVDNEFLKKHSEDCKMEAEFFKRHPTLQGEGRLRSMWLHEKVVGQTEMNFPEWVEQREPHRKELWRRTLAERESLWKDWTKNWKARQL